MNQKFFIVVIIMFLISCSSINEKNYQQRQGEVDNKSIDNSDNKKLEDVFYELRRFVADKYYNFDKHREIRISIKDVKNSYDSESFLDKFIYNECLFSFKKNPFILSSSTTDTDNDCIIEINLIKIDTGFQLVTNVLNTNNIPLYSKSYIFDLNFLNFPKYKEFIENYQKARNEINTEINTKANLIVKAINIGSSYDAKQEIASFSRTITGRVTGRHRSYNYDANRQDVIKRNIGVSGYYPAAEKCTINGKTFSLDENKIFFKGNVDNGTIVIESSFKPMFWNAGTKQEENSDDIISKKFILKVKENDKVIVEIYNIYRGEKPQIKIKAYKEKQINRDREIETEDQNIEVFSD